MELFGVKQKDATSDPHVRFLIAARCGNRGAAAATTKFYKKLGYPYFLQETATYLRRHDAGDR
jgi:hypothetical protein